MDLDAHVGVEELGLQERRVPVRLAQDMHRMHAGGEPAQRTRRQQRRVRQGAWRFTALESLQAVAVSDIGARDLKCPHCKAWRWRDETPGLCCRDGRVQLPALEEPPPLLWGLLPRAGHKEIGNFLIISVIFEKAIIQFLEE